mmetsp:Transcript_44320/g.77798  ORF Transcript_44320/g.77798 Transcript_44320/m.77798 type:complete len:449 (-) Transcript_44320:238-1584(-)
MDPEDLQALLSAAAREIGAVAAELSSEVENEKADPVYLEVLEARSAVDDAIQAAKLIKTEPTEVAREALALRAEAVRARDVAESRLWAIQDEHAELLEQLQRLTSERARKSEELRLEAAAAAAREADLIARCDELGDEVRWLRADVDRKSQRLIASSTLGHSLDLSRRRLQRQHDGSLEENTVAREILELQQSTEKYLQRMEEEGVAVNESLVGAQKSFQERMEKLQTEWSEQQARYQDEMATLSAKLTELQREYEERWSRTERESREKLEEKARVAAEVRANFEEKLANLDQEWKDEAAAARDAMDRQKQSLVEARQGAVADMEGKLVERRRELQAKVDVERQKCGVLRNKQQRRIAEFEGEVNRYKKHISDLSASYRSRRKGPPSPFTPRNASTAGMSPRSRTWCTWASSPHSTQSPRSPHGGLPGLSSRGSSRPGSRSGFTGVQE